MKHTKQLLSIALGTLFITMMSLLPITVFAARTNICLIDIASPTSQKAILSSTNIGSYLETRQGNTYQKGFYIGYFSGYGTFDNYNIDTANVGSMIYDLIVPEYNRFSVTVAPSAFWGAKKNGTLLMPQKGVAGIVRFYVDGKEVKNITITPISNDNTVDIDLANASEFRIVSEGLSVVFGDPYFYYK